MPSKEGAQKCCDKDHDEPVPGTSSCSPVKVVAYTLMAWSFWSSSGWFIKYMIYGFSWLYWGPRIGLLYTIWRVTGLSGKFWDWLWIRLCF